MAHLRKTETAVHESIDTILENVYNCLEHGGMRGDSIGGLLRRER